MVTSTLKVGVRFRYWRTQIVTKIVELRVEGVAVLDHPLVWMVEEIVCQGPTGKLKVGQRTETTLPTVLDMLQKELMEIEEARPND